jgi:hypothetical protein
MNGRGVSCEHDPFDTDTGFNNVRQQGPYNEVGHGGCDQPPDAWSTDFARHLK